MSSDYKPKLSIEITESQQQGLRNIDLPHGYQKALFSAIIDDLLSVNSEHGPRALALIITGAVRPATIIPCVAKAITESDTLRD